MKEIVIIDTFAFLFRLYYAIPKLKSKDGHPTGVLTGFKNLVENLTKDSELEYIIFCADSSKGNFRKELYSDYKANRKETDEELKIQIPIVLEWIEKMGFSLVVKDGYEADDLIATLATEAKKSGVKAKIVGSDKDLYQLIEDDKVVIYDSVKKSEIKEADCIKKFGVHPRDFIDFQALVGDSSDNIPGVKGVGQVTASKLINEYKTLDNIYENIDKIEPIRVRNLLIENKQNAYLSKELVTLTTNAFNNINFSDYTMPEDPIGSIAGELERFGIKIDRSKRKKKRTIKIDHTLITEKQYLDLIIDQIPAGSIVAFDTETDSLDANSANLVGFSFAFNENMGYYCAIGHNYLGSLTQLGLDDAKDAIVKLFSKFKIVGHNLKFDLKVLKSTLDLIDLPFFSDTVILAWLIDSSKKFALEDLAFSLLDEYKMVSFKEAIKGLDNFSQLDLENASKYAAEDAVITLILYNIFNEYILENESDLINHTELEFDFLRVLARMETKGVKIDIDSLKEFKIRVDSEIVQLQDEIYELAGETFNINSTQQLAMVLFERLNLPTQKKTKTGFSTDESVLNELKELHPIINKLLKYRELAKLKSTYTDPIIDLANKDKNHRIYTNFSQVGTTTGRLSSSEPNLQNIPARSDLGKEIRRAFIAKENHKLIGADYSQIELRLLAHFSKDPTLIDAFKNGMDIHLETAKKLFGEDEAKAKRNLAKSVNFGLLYGMGQRKLADDTGITTAEAKEIIKNYFDSFPTVKSYLDSIKDEAKKLGFVATLLGRKRRFDFANATGQYIAAYEREAVNTRFQGSAADLIKIAMVRLDKKFRNNEKISMLLQIHDELIFEVHDSYINEAKEIIFNEMINAYKLDINLDVSVSVGENWADLK